MPVLKTIVEDIAAEMRGRLDRGEVASYIPELARADPAAFGLAVIDADGEVALDRRVERSNRAHAGRVNRKPNIVPRTIAFKPRGEAIATAATKRDIHPTSATIPVLRRKMRVAAIGAKKAK